MRAFLTPRVRPASRWARFAPDRGRRAGGRDQADSRCRRAALASLLPVEAWSYADGVRCTCRGSTASAERFGPAEVDERVFGLAHALEFVGTLTDVQTRARTPSSPGRCPRAARAAR